MSTVNADAIKPRDTNVDITLGATGDTTVISANSINTNTIQDSGGNTLFQSNGSGTLSNLNSAFGGAETLILSQSLSTLGTEIIFVHGTNGVVFDDTYDHYIWRCYNHQPTAAAQAVGRYQWSSDSGSTWGGYSGLDTTSSYVMSTHQEDNDPVATNFAYSTDYRLYNSSDQVWIMAGTGSAECANGEVILYTPYADTFRHVVMSDSIGAPDGDRTLHSMIDANIRDQTSVPPAINAVRFIYDSSTWLGTIKMYGVK